MSSSLIRIFLIIVLMNIIYSKVQIFNEIEFNNKTISNFTSKQLPKRERNLQSVKYNLSDFRITEELNFTFQNNSNQNPSMGLVERFKNIPNINIWADYFNYPEVIVYFYNKTYTNNTLKIKNKREAYLPSNYINDVSAPVTITKNEAYLKMQITLTEDYLERSDCSKYELRDFNFVSIKNCSFSLLDPKENFLTQFNLIILTMLIDQTSINQCIVEFPLKEDITNTIKSSSYDLNAYPNYLTSKIKFKECKQSFCKDIEKSESDKKQEIYEPLFNQYNFQLKFLNLDDYEFELFRAFLIVRKIDYDLDIISKNIADYNMIYYFNNTNAYNNNISNKNNKINNTDYNFQEGNSIAFFTDITKILLNKGTFYQLNLDVFPEVFDLKLIFDVQRMNYNNNLNIENISNSSDLNKESKNSLNNNTPFIHDPHISVEFEVNIYKF